MTHNLFLFISQERGKIMKVRHSLIILSLFAGMLASPALAQEAERVVADRLKELKNKASS